LLTLACKSSIQAEIEELLHNRSNRAEDQLEYLPFSKQRVCSPTMEINPILNSLKEFSERTQSLRGYLD